VALPRRLHAEPEPMHPVQNDQGPLRIGDTYLSKYEIRALIGRGGNAHVYHGHDPFLGRDVAIKILHRAGGLTREMIYRGRTEARILVGLKHPNIVDVYDAGIDGDALYIIMERLLGRTFRDVLREQGRLEVIEVLELFAPIADAIELAHQKGVIHRDLKPENIFITPGNLPKVLDFGIAKIMDKDAFQTQRNMILGTGLYLSPEQLLGEAATRKSDIYALGLMGFEALLGRHACLLENRSLEPEVINYAQAFYKPKRLDKFDPLIPDYVAAMVHRAISKPPGQRFSTMKEVHQEICTSLSRYRGMLAQQKMELLRRDLSHAQAARSPLPPALAASDSLPSELKGTHEDPEKPSAGDHPFVPVAAASHRLRPGAAEAFQARPLATGSTDPIERHQVAPQGAAPHQIAPSSVRPTDSPARRNKNRSDRPSAWALTFQRRPRATPRTESGPLPRAEESPKTSSGRPALIGSLLARLPRLSDTPAPMTTIVARRPPSERRPPTRAPQKRPLRQMLFAGLVTGSLATGVLLALSFLRSTEPNPGPELGQSTAPAQPQQAATSNQVTNNQATDKQAAIDRQLAITTPPQPAAESDPPPFGPTPNPSSAPASNSAHAAESVNKTPPRPKDPSLDRRERHEALKDDTAREKTQKTKRTRKPAPEGVEPSLPDQIPF
jgi:serine/threonine protein kinase